MARSWLIDSRGIAKKVKNAAQSVAYQIKDCGANRECPNCNYHIDNSDVFPEWPGLPAGVKFDPSDGELLEHLSAKCGIGKSKSHMFIDEFIPTLEGDLGICYTHPENLPGVKKDGSSSHFFHRTVNAYATGQRKRRKIHNENRVMEEDVRWHKTGKTKPVVENGLQKGCKKIMVLYKSSKKGCRADKSNWVMHQYHLGTEEDEEGQYVVSKIFYQQQKVSEKNDEEAGVEDPDVITVRTSPRTPKTNPPNPPRSENSVPHDDIADDTKLLPSSPKDAEAAPKAFQASTPADQLEDDVKYREWLADASLYDSLLCNEILDSYTPSNNPGPSYAGDSSYAPIATALMGDKNITCGISDLENLEFDTPPDFQLADLQFGSQDSVFDWLDRL